MSCAARFERLYQQEPEGISFCPYRICPIGAHVDHNFGLITGLALDRGIHIAYRATENGSVELSSLQFDRQARWHVQNVPEKKTGDWADHLRGAVTALLKRYPLQRGLCGVIEGTLPIGGLSSSAAVILSFLSALCRVNGIRLSPKEMIETALEAENQYVGVACGKLDQSCEVYCKKDHLLYLDTQDDSFELIPTSPQMKPYQIAIFFSGIERTLAGSRYNMRADELKSAAYALKAYADLPYETFAETRMRDVPLAVYQEHRHRLPENWRRRADHFFSEMDRVKKGVEAWRRGDLEAFGRLSFESGYSSIHSWETGSEELCALYEILLHTDGVWGGRFSGAGFKGCCMALIDPDRSDEILDTVRRRYCTKFPSLQEKYSAHLCMSADGVLL